MKWFSLSVVVVLAGFLAGCQLEPKAAELPVKPVRIAFMSNRDTNFEIYMMERDGTELTRLTDLSEVNKVLPAWSPRSRALAFLTNQVGEDDYQLIRSDDEGQNQQLLSADLVVAPGPINWSPTGEWVSFGAGRDAEAEVYIADAQGENIINLSNNPGEDLFGDWSPDGRELLIVSGRDEGNLVIYMVGVEGGEPIQITNPMFNSGRPVWSPDGEKIAFMTNRDGGDIEVYSIDTGNGELLRLTDSPGFDGYPVWSPDGHKIAFLSGRDGNAEIYVMNTDGTGPTNLTQTPDSDESVQGDFSWSPDGEQIMFHSNQDGNVEVYVMNADGSNPINLTNNPALDFGSTWIE